MGSKARHTEGKPKLRRLEELREFTNDFAHVLGEGSYGIVYKGVDDEENKITVKVLHERKGSSQEQEFKREFESLLTLSHQNIIPLVGYCYEIENKYNRVLKKSEPILRTAMCFEYAPRGNLGRYISDRGDKLDWPTCYKIIKGTCEGLFYLHNHPSGSEMWHLDLKPENILLNHDMVPKIADFGLSKLITDQTRKATGNPFGTSKYTPPEFKKRRVISKEFDIYSLGVIILEIVAGTKIYEDTTKFSQKVADLVFEKWRPRLFRMNYGQVKTCLKIALKCIDDHRHKRPKIRDIIDEMNKVENMIQALSRKPIIIDLRRQFSNDDLNKVDNLTTKMSLSLSPKSNTGTPETIIARHDDNTVDPVNMESQQPLPRSSIQVPVNMASQHPVDCSSIQMEPKSHLPLEYLEDITNNFCSERILGKGGFGVVYKGLLENGEMIAVKKLLHAMPSSQKQFENEVNLLMKLEHPNIVRLVGYCYETQHLYTPHEGKSVFAWNTECLLCLECLPNGSLDKYISDASSGLDWHTRCKIIDGISYGLQYLHDHSSEPIIHLDLKPANILLDGSMLPKITDFGLSRLFDQNKTVHTAITSGTFGYMPPEFLRGIITPMSDIFSLGVIILEVITGHRDYPYDIKESSLSFIELELQKWRNALQKEPEGCTSLEMKCQKIERYIQIGLICVNPERTKRPAMKKVINMLEGSESMSRYISNELSSGVILDES